MPKAQLSAETFNQYSACAKNLHGMAGLTSEQLALEIYDMSFPTKHSLANRLHGVTKDNCYRKYMELQTEA